MIDPPVWSSEWLEAERQKARGAFSKERLEEPLEDYLEAFDTYQGYIEEVLETTVDLSDFHTSALDVLGDPRLLEVFRYLAAPPISQDDLKVLADADSLAKGHLKESPDLVQRLYCRASGARSKEILLGSGESRTYGSRTQRGGDCVSRAHGGEPYANATARIQQNATGNDGEGSPEGPGFHGSAVS